MMVWTVHELAVGPGLGIPVPTLGCPCRQPGTDETYWGWEQLGLASLLPSHGCHAGFFSQLLQSSVSGVAMASSSAWPTSGRDLWLLLGRDQVVLCGVCLAEVRSGSLRSAWPSSRRRRRLLQLLVVRVRCLQGAVVLQVPSRVFQRVLRLSVFCSSARSVREVETS